MKRFSFLLILFGVLSSATHLRAAPSDALDTALSTLRSVKGLAGEFVQVNRSGLSGAAREESGSCILLPGGEARFDYAKPAGKIAIAAGGNWLLYLPRDRQLMRQPLGEDSAPGLLFAGAVELRRRFKVELRALAGGGSEISLQPKNAAAGWEKISILLGEGGLPRSFTFYDGSGGSTELRLTLRPVAPPAATFFQFTPPPGTDIVGE